MSSPAVDRDALIALLDGNPDLIVTIIDSFLGDCPDYMDAIREAVETGDAEVLKREAHGLKGAAGSLRAKSASEAAEVLEEMGRSGDFAEAEAALETLEQEIGRLKEDLRALRRECQDESADE
jgi:HPt (histidine-containing phosphotransfer) domain-containing protein